MSYTTTKTLLIPTIRNLKEARSICHDFDAVITAGPRKAEVSDFDHADHLVVSFADTSFRGYGDAPSIEDVEEMISWGTSKTNLLVHCHAGISRSTATAWGIAIANGNDPEHAIRTLKQAHPMEGTLRGRQMQRPFSPNRLIVEHIEDILGYRENELVELSTKYSEGWW